MKLFCADKFEKSIPIEKRKKINTILFRVEQELKSSTQGIFGTSIKTQSRKFVGTDKVFKFRVDDSDRIIFKYTNDLDVNGCRPEERNGIYLIEYVSHDDQNRIGKKVSESKRGVLKEFKTQMKKSNFLEEITEEETHDRQYEQYCDLDKVVSYVIQAGDFNTEIVESVRINSQQYHYIQSNNPLLLIGGAGSGKTLVAVHKLNSYSGYSNQIIYFTFSNNLCKEAKKIFSKIEHRTDKKILFNTLNQYCMEELELKESNFVGYDRFREWFKSKAKDKLEIDAIDIWAEIRGLVKGYMGKNWKRNYPFDFRKIDNESSKYLKTKGYIVEVDNNSKVLRCTVTTSQSLEEALLMIEQDENCLNKEAIKESFKKIYNHAVTFSYREKMIPKVDYLSFNKKRSVFSVKEREEIYSLCLDYEKWIKENALFDDNDLAGMMLENKTTKLIFDYVVVDEVQDLTELQIYLITSLVQDINNITFAGDIHQIINPTYYDDSRLKNLYRIKKRNLEEAPLTMNYRNQKNIIKLANDMSQIRRKFIAKKKQVTENTETAIIEGDLLYSLFPNKKNLIKMLNTLKENPKAAIIVADEEDSRKLEKTIERDIPNIFTVQEVKGLEFDYVFTYNLSTRYSDSWEEIFAGAAKKNAKYRYYFNLFYVAITRAKNNLCIYEEDNIFLKNRNIKKHFISIDEFDKIALSLNLKEISKEEWGRQAALLEDKDKLERAITYYQKSQSGEKNIQRCQAKLRAKEGDYDSAIDILLEINEYELAMSFADQSQNKEKYMIALILSGGSSPKEIDKKFRNEKVLSSIAKYIENDRFAEELYEKYFLEKIEDIQNKFVDIKEEINLWEV